MIQSFAQNNRLLCALWLLTPISMGLGILWDGLQASGRTQGLYGATGNFLVLFWLLATPFLLWSLWRSWAVFRQDMPVLLGWLALMVWAWLGILMADMARLMPLLSASLLLPLGLFALHWRAAIRRQGLVSFLPFLFSYLIVLTLGLGVAMAVHLLGPTPDKQPYLHVDGFSNVRTFGEAALFVWVGFVGIALVRSDHPAWSIGAAILLWVALFLVAVGLFWSGTRAAWLGGFVAMNLLGGIALWWDRARAARVMACITFVTALGFLSSFALPLPSSEYGAGRVALFSQDMATLSKGHDAAEKSDSRGRVNTGNVRVAKWLWGIDAIAARPLFGQGLVSMAYSERENRPNFVHLHNFPLDMLYGLGIPAGLVVVGAMVWGWIGLFRAALRRVPGATALLGIATALGVTSLFAGTLLFLLTLVPTVAALSAGPLLARSAPPKTGAPPTTPE